ncbi:hypothetical protein EV192_10439 [Actinocrispum wychmicini]|uniref:Guanylate cyclase domain-containing protein n=2 Tax=Actinocrispum wychmicini TaxID=1213861 RepID=A0A4R2JQW2_9PSEU|nr:hypothetical protein EV192_10439 [Actinocrispum wychmicini]
MVVDVAGFTNPARRLPHLVAVQEGLYVVLEKAFAESGIPWDLCAIEDRGDGVMILIPADVSKTRLTDQFPDRVVAGLRRYNADHARSATFQLRIGLHFGEVYKNKNGVVSRAVNDAFRILDASAAKAALKKSAGMVAFIASDLFYREVILQDPAADPDSYQQIRVEVKDFSGDAWMCLRGIPTPRDLAAQPHTENALPVLADADLESLAGWLADVTVAHPATIVRRAANPNTPIPRSHNAWDMFLELNDINAGEDGLPPALVFLGLVAHQLDGQRGADVTEWANTQARRLRLESRFRERVTAESHVPENPRLHLLIAFEPHSLYENQYWLSYWRQDDPEAWPPNRARVGLVALADLERAVEQVVLAAERTWSDSLAAVMIEFLVPRSLIDLHIHEWEKDKRSTNPRPLRLDYPIVLRSLERMSSIHWHRMWHHRWRLLVADPSPQRVHFSQPSDHERPYQVDALLSNPQLVSSVLSAAPPTKPPAQPGVDEYTAALQCGLPALIWHQDGLPDELREVVDSLLDDEGLGALPERVHTELRGALAASQGSPNINILHGLVVLWDSPERRVELDLPGTSSGAAKESADEH